MKVTPQNIYRWTTIAWLAGMSVHLMGFILQHRHRLPTDEVYAQFLSFQIADRELFLHLSPLLDWRIASRSSHRVRDIQTQSALRAAGQQPLLPMRPKPPPC